MEMEKEAQAVSAQLARGALDAQEVLVLVLQCLLEATEGLGEEEVYERSRNH